MHIPALAAQVTVNAALVEPALKVIVLKVKPVPVATKVTEVGGAKELVMVSEGVVAPARVSTGNVGGWKIPRHVKEPAVGAAKRSALTPLSVYVTVTAAGPEVGSG
jgi:hypothetical protein